LAADQLDRTEATAKTATAFAGCAFLRVGGKIEASRKKERLAPEVHAAGATSFFGNIA
jgi:hypothetical protein